ncbi:MAG: hypothetical protein LBG92_07525 [Prevotellaceae bacterium]|jgi:hypothetical protein|nr:hypothetical protein [Prevotellaceae bacterium]
MRNLFLIAVFILGSFFNQVFSQNFLWNANLRPFFQNTEFGFSKVQMPQTMAGVHLAPEVGVGWDENKHRIFAGVDVMHEWGSNKMIDFSDITAYYEYDGKPFRFYAGAFPRHLTLEKYPRMFFQDSINNYRPIINGFFLEFNSNRDYLNLWLDWTSRQTTERHEAFFMGWSGRYNFDFLYGQHFGYMFHYAGVMNPQIEEGLHDNGLALTSLGVDFAPKTEFEKLEANIGWSVGLERDRSIGNWHFPHGLVSEIKIEYQGLGLHNTYYRGKSQQVFYGNYGNKLYWGDPIYRSKEYNRSDFYISFLDTDFATIKVIYSLHFTEQTVYHDQSFSASFNLGNLKRKKSKNYRHLWDKWF